MTDDLRRGLEACETDIAGAISRFAGDENMYVTCLYAFLDDPTMAALNEAVKARSWDEAFTAAHALKGLAGNLGFAPLFHTTAELVMLIRSGRVSEIEDSLKRIKLCYGEIVSVIRVK